jgi:hypothetical protein
MIKQLIHNRRSIVGGLLVAKAADDLIIPLEHGLTGRAVENLLELTTDIFHREGVGQQFCDHLAVGNKID